MSVGINRAAGSVRTAVSALFFANGMMIGSWAPKLPVLMERLEISESTAGMVVLCLGLGSISLMPVFGAMTARHGSARAVKLSALLGVPTIAADDAGAQPDPCHDRGAAFWRIHGRDGCVDERQRGCGRADSPQGHHVVLPRILEPWRRRRSRAGRCRPVRTGRG